MTDRNGVNIKSKIILAAVLIGAALSFLTFLFVQDVSTQLWEQSIHTIMESTKQGCTTLRIQLQEAYEDMEDAAVELGGYSLLQKQEIGEILEHSARSRHGVSLYLPDGTCLPGHGGWDEEAGKQIFGQQGESGIINPHISSVTGVNVFNLYNQVVLADGTKAYLVKEYEVDTIVDSFSLSFYDNAGFSYVVNTKGDILIRSPHPGSNKTVRNLFDMLDVPQNAPEQLEEFSQALENAGNGWAVFTYQGEKTVFCFIPLKLQSDWYLVSIIPQHTVNEQTNEILMRALSLMASIILGISVLAAFYIRYVRRTNKRLMDQAAYIGHLYNAVPEGIALITVEEPNRFIQLNREGMELLGYPEGTSNEAISGRSIREVILPDDHEDMDRLLDYASREGGKAGFEKRMLKNSGEVFWGAGILEKTMDENGTPVLIATFHDITAEKLEEEAAERDKLQERITLVGAISNAYPVIIRLNLTRDTLNFIYVRQGLMTDLGSQQTYSRLYEDFSSGVHPDNRKEYASRFSLESLRESLVHNKNEVFLESKHLLADGEYHWISTQIIYVDNPYSDDMLAILISRRIDEQRHEEEQQRLALESALDSAKAASNAKSRFLSNMSHDIRTPMNAIIGMTAIAAAHIDDRDRVLECLKKINLSGKHLLSLINDVLDMSKIENGKLSMRDEPFNFPELVADAAELIRSQANAGRLAMDVCLSPMKHENVVGDPLRMRQVCINILSNAVKYTPPGGFVRIEAWQEESPVLGYANYVFRCTDTGVGMEPSFLEHIFQPFERARDHAGMRVAGTGLGMAITKNIIDLMNGDIHVESSPGKGSVFTISIPLKLQDAPKEQVPEAWLGINSLIVDDDRQTCLNAVELLRDMGLRACFVTDGETGVRYVADAKDTKDPYELIIIDWKMPGMDGVETARRIRENVGEAVPVIILTAYDWSEIECEAREAGVTAFISKPFYRSKMCYLLRGLDGSAGEDKRTEKRLDYKGKRILLVEDNEINREIAGTLIREMGIMVEEAVDGGEAVDKVMRSEEGYYDLIFMDIQMPVMDGYQAARAIRGLERRDVCRMPIIAMTANAFEEDVRAAIRAGMNAHFSKPIDLDALESLLSRYLNGESGK
ncbi:response regulator [Lachnoclostridium pacaense]|uniref:response regulator n=1 Tax=Enterocloster hominis (ex Hitch et al. 2024) TaxID=1917870 RepID=UPI001D101020|nr:response regulator [Lachnoclostridium pacaense]MCC2879152.1 response regulator [Lachnoclostridium pacaense]